MTNKTTVSTLIAILVLALAAITAWLWFQRDATELTTPTPPSSAASAPLQAALPASAIEVPAPVASQPQIQFPIEPVEAAASQPVAGEFDIGKALAGLLGSKTANQFLQSADFPRRFVATVDNLGRSHAPPSMWPINPSAGRFLIDKQGDTTVINADANSARYTPFVRMVDAIDIPQAIALYVKIYPTLQQAYEGIGYPNRYFNDRFVAVVDKLLATPEPLGPLRVELTEVKGPLKSTRPWVRYEYADPGYEQLSAGQKILLRVGSDNRHRLKARLTELRQQLTRSVQKK